MAELNGGGIQYDVINTPVGHFNNLDETPVSFGIRPDLFYAKIDDRIWRIIGSNNKDIFV